MTTADISRPRLILASILQAAGQPITATIRRVLSFAPDGFDAPELGAIALAIRKASTNGAAPDFLAIGKNLSGDHVGTLNLLADTHEVLSLALADIEAEPLLAVMESRRVTETLAEAWQEAKDHPDKARTIARVAVAALQSLEAEVVAPTRYTAQPIGEIQPQPGDEADELIRHRFLCRGAGLLLAAPAGIGKSTLALQAMLCFAVGRECLGIKPTRPLRSLYIQAENDTGDIRELRDGIIAGLKFSEVERAQAFASVHVITIDDLCGPEFISRAVDPLCNELKPDILWIDPLLSYIGGDVSRQEVVSPWLRNHLNPVLHRHRVACVLIHHVNKPPSGTAKPNWLAGDFAYIGSGSAELANWPRAVIAIRSIGSHEVFELRLGKRGSRLGWKDAAGATSYSRFIAHGADGIYWREVTEAEQPAPAGRKQEHTVAEVVALLADKPLSAAHWQKLCRAESGISERTFYRLKKQAESAKLVSQSKTNQKWLKNP